MHKHSTVSFFNILIILMIFRFLPWALVGHFNTPFVECLRRKINSTFVEFVPKIQTRCTLLKRIKLGQTGFGILEAIMALVVLSVLIYSISSFITNSTQQSHKISAGASCQSAAQSTLDAITSIGVRDSILPFVLDGSDPRLTGYASHPVYQTFGSLLPNPGSYFSDLAIHGNGDLNLSHLILSSTEYLEELYNSDAGYCTGFLPVPAQLIEVPTGMTVSIQIQPVNRAGEVQACTIPLNARPVSAGPDSYSRTLGDPDLGFRSNIRVRMTDGKECTSSADYRHQLDSYMTNAIPPIAISGPGTVLAGNTFCPSGSTVVASINYDTDSNGTSNFEPGSAPLCSEDGINFSPCWSFNYGARQTGSTTFSVSGNQLELTFAGMTDQAANYWIRTTVVDSAGNQGSVSGMSFRVIAACPPPPTTTTTTSSSSSSTTSSSSTSTSSTTSTTAAACSYSPQNYCLGDDERQRETAPEPGCLPINDVLVLANSPACMGPTTTTTVTSTTVTSTSETTSTTETTTSTVTSTSESTTTTTEEPPTTTTTSTTTTTTRNCYWGVGGNSSGEDPAGQCSVDKPYCTVLWCSYNDCATAICNEGAIGDECYSYECTSSSTTTWQRGSSPCVCD